MFRDKLARLQDTLNTTAKADLIIFCIVLGLMLTMLMGAINLLPLDTLAKSLLFIPLSLLISGIGIKVLYSQNVAYADSEVEDDRSSDEVNQPISTPPPMPANPPKVSIQDIGLSEELAKDPTFAVLKKMSDRLEADALARRQAEEQERQAAEAKARLLADDTIYYDHKPTLIFFVLSQLWKIIAALAIGGVAVSICIPLTQSPESQTSAYVIMSVALIIVVWYVIRCYGKWAWTRRKIEGNAAVVQEPSNGWFLLLGKEYRISLLDCGNVVVARSLLERILGPLGVKSGTVSIETTFDNKDSGDTSHKVHDVFFNMRNMYDPDTFKRLVMTRHDELTFGQPDVIRRSEQG